MISILISFFIFVVSYLILVETLDDKNIQGRFLGTILSLAIGTLTIFYFKLILRLNIL